MMNCIALLLGYGVLGVLSFIVAWVLFVLIVVSFYWFFTLPWLGNNR